MPFISHECASLQRRLVFVSQPGDFQTYVPPCVTRQLLAVSQLLFKTLLQVGLKKVGKNSKRQG